ncbi:MAG: lipoyl synthase [Brachybacterium sp.]|nr:lipoyl synthase [Brachybacterium sp.]
MTIAPEGRRMLRVEARNAETPIERKPDWIKTRAVMGPEYSAMKKRVHGQGLHTVCEEAGCPNIFECWEDREATFLIGGDTCTRRCDFCAIATGKPQDLDPAEPMKVARSVKDMGLRYSTITGVARDDLPDGAAWLFAETCRQIHSMNPGTGVELLIDDIKGNESALDSVFEASPEVFAHNLETVPRIFKQIRPAFRYERSLEVIARAKNAGMITKSNLILGMGETTEEIIDALQQLREHGCDLITVTQYLRPSKRHHPVDRWVKPEEFLDLSRRAEEIGFLGVMAGPMVRSSYRAGRLWAQAMKKLGRPIPANLAHLDQEQPAHQEAASVVARRQAARGGC